MLYFIVWLTEELQTNKVVKKIKKKQNKTQKLANAIGKKEKELRAKFF